VAVSIYLEAKAMSIDYVELEKRYLLENEQMANQVLAILNKVKGYEIHFSKVKKHHSESSAGRQC
jgi:hypothetical protein